MLEDFLKSELIFVDIKSVGKEQVVGELASLISRNSGIKEREIFSSLMEREKIDSTGIEDAVAIPHAKIKDLNGPVVAVGISKKGVDFDSHDGKLAHLFFVLLAPEKEVSEHMKLLARLAKLLSIKGLKEKILSSNTSDDVLKLLLESEKKI